MSKLISIRVYEYQELDEYAKNKFIDCMYELPYSDEFKIHCEKYDYFADMNLAEQIEFCEINEYFFNKCGEIIALEHMNIIGYLEEEA